MSTKVYDSNQVFLSIGGRSISKGRAAGTFVTSEYAAEAFTPVVGADGEVTISRSNNKSGTIKVNLVQTSDSHRVLMALYETQQATPGGILLDYELRDLSGGLLEHGQVVIQKPPANAYGAEASEREWLFFCGELAREVTA